MIAVTQVRETEALAYAREQVRWYRHHAMPLPIPGPSDEPPLVIPWLSPDPGQTMVQEFFRRLATRNPECMLYTDPHGAGWLAGR